MSDVSEEGRAGSGSAVLGRRHQLSEGARAYLEELLGEAAPSSSPELDAAVAGHGAGRLRNSRHRAVMDLVEGARVLDLGCDIGVIAQAVAGKADQVLAIDIRPETIEIARGFFVAANVEYRLGDLFELGLSDSSFDCVLFLETVEHAEDPVTFLREIHRLLRPGGVLILSTPNALSYYELLRQLVRWWPSFRSDAGIRRLAAKVGSEAVGTGTEEDHLYAWTWETLYRLVWRCGFRYDDHRRVGFWAPSLPWGSRRFWPLGRNELTFLRPLVGPFCQTLLFKLRAVK